MREDEKDAACKDERLNENANNAEEVGSVAATQTPPSVGAAPQGGESIPAYRAGDAQAAYYPPQPVPPQYANPPQYGQQNSAPQNPQYAPPQGQPPYVAPPQAPQYGQQYSAPQNPQYVPPQGQPPYVAPPQAPQYGQMPQPSQYDYNYSQQKPLNIKAMLSLIFSISAYVLNLLFSWISNGASVAFSIIGLGLSISALVLAAMVIKRGKNGMATAGLVLSIIYLAFWVMIFIIGFALGIGLAIWGAY